MRAEECFGGWNSFGGEWGGRLHQAGIFRDRFKIASASLVRPARIVLCVELVRQYSPGVGRVWLALCCASQGRYGLEAAAGLTQGSPELQLHGSCLGSLLRQRFKHV